MNYYNENDAKAAAWLRELIKENLIPNGDVDERSIADVRATDLVGYTQCHFFCGIAGWSLALRLAGWPRDRPVWTGSAPCQPFSVAGKGVGEGDERHLWPHFRRLIDDGEPAVVFGEQVASPAGRKWLARVRADLEGLGYGVGAADLCAAGVGAPHIRQRLWWVAYASDLRGAQQLDQSGQGSRRKAGPQYSAERAGPRGLADAHGGNPGSQRQQRGGQHGQQSQDGGFSGLVNSNGGRLEERTQRDGEPIEPGQQASCGADALRSGPWSAFDLLPCTDGKSRRVEPGTPPLAHGVPGRVGLLRGYGNAIVPQVAAEFIQACEEARELV